MIAFVTIKIENLANQEDRHLLAFEDFILTLFFLHYSWHLAFAVCGRAHQVQLLSVVCFEESTLFVIL